mgnify:CR=1 FL=1
MIFALAGNQNCGKTTLFNQLTGSNQHVGNFPGVTVESYQQREYPYGAELAHVVGYVSKINDKDVERLNNDGKLANYAATHDIGKLGIERYYEDVLHGQTGYEEVEVNRKPDTIFT